MRESDRQQNGEREIELTDVCFRLGLGYHAARNKVFRRELQGRKDERGRLVVTEKSVRAYEERMARAQRSNRTAA